MLAIEIRLNSIQQKWTINLLYIINMHPLVVIYVVQYIYYQNLITQNVSIRNQTNSIQQKSTINLLYIINMHPLVVIYVILVYLLSKFNNMFECQHSKFRPFNSFQQKSYIYYPINLLIHFINMHPLVIIYVVQYIYYQNLITQNVSIRNQTNSIQQKSTIKHVIHH